jgi:hypothetical protein
MSARAMSLASRFFDCEDPDAVFDLYYRQGWTDGLPIVPPTEPKIRAMIAAVGKPPSTVLAAVPPRMAEATVEKVAINAVLAGCVPEYLPVVVAAVQAVCEPIFNLHGIQTTTNPVAPLIVVNGPIRSGLDINCGRNALGQGRRANATIGRALRFVLQNIGGGIPGAVDKATLGMPAKFTFCLGEDEEGSPWSPFHVDRGFRRDQSVVTVFGAQGTDNVCYLGSRGRGALDLVADAMATKGNNNVFIGAGNPLVIFPSGHAQRIAGEGFSKADVQRYLWERSAMPADAYDAQDIAPMFTPCIVDGKVRVTRRPDDIAILVAGGPEPYHIAYLPSFGETEIVSRPIDA